MPFSALRTSSCGDGYHAADTGKDEGSLVALEPVVRLILTIH